MPMSPHILLFLSTMLLGTIMSLSGSSWLTIWLGMELNLISFIPLMTSSSNNKEHEAAVKYFLVQAWSGSVFLLSMLNPSLYILGILALAMKSGMPPLHFWYPTAMKSLSWHVCILLSTVQKFQPLLLMFWFLAPKNPLISLLAITSALVGAIGGLTQTHLRPILAYSSINHMGWMTATASIAPAISSIYLIMYSILVIPVMLIMSQLKVSSLKTFTGPLSVMIILSLMLMSIAGLPPTTGFAMKLMSLTHMINNNFYITPTILLLSSAITLSFYMNVIFFCLLSSNSNPTVTTPNISVPYMATLTLGAMWGLPLILNV